MSTYNIKVSSVKIREKLLSLGVSLDGLNERNEIVHDSNFDDFLKLNDYNLRFEEFMVEASKVLVPHRGYETLDSTSFLEWHQLPFPSTQMFTTRNLDSLPLDELESLFSSIDSQNYYDLIKIRLLINKRRYAQWLSIVIRKLKKVLKNIISSNKKRLENKREIIRRVHSFDLKNLDDTHSTIVFN